MFNPRHQYTSDGWSARYCRRLREGFTGGACGHSLRRSPSPPSRLRHCCAYGLTAWPRPAFVYVLLCWLLQPGFPPASPFAFRRIPSGSPPTPSKRGFPVRYRRLPFPSGFASRIRAESQEVQQSRQVHISFRALTVSAQLRVEFPRPAALLQGILRRHACFGLPLRISTAARNTSAPKNLRVTLRKSLSVGCPRLACSPRLGSGDLSLLVARDRWAQKEKENYLNRVELIGFLGREPETKSTPNGKAATSLSLATKTSWMKGTERQERTEWHRIQVIWN